MRVCQPAPWHGRGRSPIRACGGARRTPATRFAMRPPCRHGCHKPADREGSRCPGAGPRPRVWGGISAIALRPRPLNHKLEQHRLGSPNRLCYPRLANVWQQMAQLWRSLVEIGPNSANLGMPGPKLANVGQISAEIGLTLADARQTPPKFGQTSLGVTLRDAWNTPASPMVT